MDRDIERRLSMFANVGMEKWERGFRFCRVALTMWQIEQFAPPPNPAKITDSRAKRYIANHGRESWELDALDPSVLSELVRGHVERLTSSNSVDILEPTRGRERAERDKLVRVREEFERGER